MKFLFINAIDTSRSIQQKYPPLGIGHLISALRERFPDRIEFRVVDRDIPSALQSFSPDIVGISAVTQNFGLATRYATEVKSFDESIPVLCGGCHISMMPSSLTEDMDVGVIGEGEETLCELVGHYPSLKTTKGIVYHEDGILRATEPRPNIAPLDLLPPPARDLFPVHPATYMFTSRGCPYKCAFCSSTRFWRGVRYFSPEYIVDEIERLVDMGVRSICFYDDIFPLKPKRVRDTIALLRERSLLGRVEFTCSIRANMVDDEIVSLLKEMGVTAIGLGFESGCERILQYLKGGSVTLSDNVNAVETIKRHGLEVSGTFIIGSPTESYWNIMETYRFIKEHRLAAVAVYPLTPLPGTPVWDYALSRGLVSNDMEWSRLDVDGDLSDAVILSNQLTRGQLSNLLSMFGRLRTRRYICRLTRAALRHPARIPGFIYRKLRYRE